MAPVIGEQCDNCLRHIQKNHHIHRERCEKCLPDGGTLQSCGGCRSSRYCGKKCQKEHWNAHKPICRIHESTRKRAEAAGVTERMKDFKKWVAKNIQTTICAGVSALELHRDRERTETHVFVVYLDAILPLSSTHSNKRIDYSIRSASCITLEKVHGMFAPRLAGGSAALDRDLAPRGAGRVLKILIIDDGLPPPMDMYSNPATVGEDMRQVPSLGVNWLTTYKQLVNAARK